MWEVWSYPDYSYTDGEGVLEGTFETYSEADLALEDFRGPLRFVNRERMNDDA